LYPPIFAEVKATNGFPVHNLDTHLNYTAIQAAIDAPETLDGHTIFVEAGTYYENIVVNKTLLFIGEDSDNTVIDCGGNGNGVLIVANGVRFTRFAVASADTGVIIGSNYTAVENVKVFNNHFGIWASQSAYCVINKCRITNQMVKKGPYEDFGGGGLLLDQCMFCNVTNNYMNSNELIGIWVRGGFNLIKDNIITDSIIGLDLDEVSNCTVAGNNVSNNAGGIECENAYNSGIYANTIWNNSYSGISLAGSNNNLIYHNNFINNTRHVEKGLGLLNVWDFGYPSGGNYWSNYTGVDFYKGLYQNETGSDGIGDAQHVINENNKDCYPLMHPWSLLSVHNINTGLGYDTIQEAINANETIDGHVIFVEAGTYYENLVINKTVSLVGENREATIIDGNKIGTVIYIERTDNVSISEFTIRNSLPLGLDEGSGIYLKYSSCNNTIRRNIITSNGIGIYVRYDSDNNIITENEIKNNGGGVILYMCSNNTLTYNRISDNLYNFAVEVIGDLSHFLHNIDTSNTVNGKPIYYLTNQNNLTIDSSTSPNIGYLALVNSTNVTVKNLNLTNSNYQEILFAFTTNSSIGNTNVSTVGIGISLVCSKYNTIINSVASDCGGGILLERSSNNHILNNTITSGSESGILIENLESTDNFIEKNRLLGNQIGIHLSGYTSKNQVINNALTSNVLGISIDYSDNNTIVANEISNNLYGITSNAYHNKIFHNNFINNTNQVSINQSVDIWDNGVEGNYWSNYNGVDSDYDGIGDSWYEIDSSNIDHYPLMGRFSDFNATSEHHVQTVCNSSISSFQYNGTAISFYVTGDNGTTGFCRICIPTALMNATYKVYVNSTEVSYNFLPCSNETYSYLYFNYTHSTHEIIIVPEFPLFYILPVFMIATLLAVAVYKRKHSM
jgi:parallel beta-helix repeat protein